MPSSRAAALTSSLSRYLGAMYSATARATSDSGRFDTNDSISSSVGTKPGSAVSNILAASLVLTYSLSYVELSTLFNTAVSVTPRLLRAVVAASALPAFFTALYTVPFNDIIASAIALPEYSVAPTPTPDIAPMNPFSNTDPATS